MTRFVSLIRRLEDFLLVTILGLMVLLASLQILLRNVFEGGMVWADPLLRILVLWVTLLGAITASRDNNNISIAALVKILPQRMKPLVRTVTSAFTTGVCALLAWHGARFAYMDYQEGILAYANVPAWLAESIIPVGFTLMGLRYVAMTFLELKGVLTGAASE